jgi:MarR family transcriptional regulator for hemolysin
MPERAPIGLRVTRTAHVVAEAFDQALAEAGGSLATWQVLLLVRSQEWGAQGRIAEAMGISGATMTHHLNALEAQGLVRRWREVGNRRAQRVELTKTGEELFDRLRRAALAFDRRLRSELSEREAAQLGRLLEKLQAGVGRTDAGEG